MFDGESKIVSTGKKIATAVGGVIVGIIVLTVVLGSWHIVPAGHRGVLVTMGHVSPSARTEGLMFKWPWIQKVVDLSIRQCTLTTEGASCFTSDLQDVSATFSILGRIPPEKAAVLYQQYTGESVEDYFNALVAPRANACLKQVTAMYKLEEIAKKREAIKNEALESLRRDVGDIWIIDDMAVVNLAPSEELAKAIEAKQIKEQEAQAKQYELQMAQKDAEIKVTLATGDAEAINRRGEALARNPKVLDWEIIQRWDQKTPSTVVLGAGAGGANVLLPIVSGGERR